MTEQQNKTEVLLWIGIVLVMAMIAFNATL
jgi:hypothetical protein